MILTKIDVYKRQGGIRVILGEQGYIAANSSQEDSQAAATAYEFYIASANTKVDAIMNRAYLDDSAEGIMTLGLRYNWSAKNHPAKKAYSVVKHIDVYKRQMKYSLQAADNKAACISVSGSAE